MSNFATIEVVLRYVNLKVFKNTILPIALFHKAENITRYLLIEKEEGRESCKNENADYDLMLNLLRMLGNDESLCFECEACKAQFSYS